MEREREREIYLSAWYISIYIYIVLLYRSPDLLQVAVEADDDLPDSLHRQVAREPFI